VDQTAKKKDWNNKSMYMSFLRIPSKNATFKTNFGSELRTKLIQCASVILLACQVVNIKNAIKDRFKHYHCEVQAFK
jgi:hypothetical protein